LSLGVALSRALGGHLVRPELAVLLEAHAPCAKRLVEIFNVFHLQAPLQSEWRHGGEGRLLQQEDVLYQGVDENVVAQ
jgi:hypothetical protein